MIKIQFLSALLCIIFALLSALQSFKCRPVSFSQKHKEKVARRVHLKAAQNRLKDIQWRHARRIRSKRRADEEGITRSNSIRAQWVKVDMAHEKVNANIRRHRLAGMIFGKKDPEINDSLNHRASQLEDHAKKSTKRKINLKVKVTTAFHLRL